MRGRAREAKRPEDDGRRLGVRHSTERLARRLLAVRFNRTQGAAPPRIMDVTDGRRMKSMRGLVVDGATTLLQVVVLEDVINL